MTAPPVNDTIAQREREILHAEIRGSAAEFFGWLTGLTPPAEREAIPPHLRAAFDKMCDRLGTAVMNVVVARADMRAFSASDAACYKWPEDTQEHRASRAAYCEGAADYGCSPVHAGGTEEAR